MSTPFLSPKLFQSGKLDIDDDIYTVMSLAADLMNANRRAELFPVVHFHFPQEQIILVKTAQVSSHITKGRERITYSRVQLPLRLAYALTIHKSQGQTIDNVVLDIQSAGCGDRAVAGLVYVGMSRVRSPENIQVVGFQPGKVFIDRELVEKYG